MQRAVDRRRWERMPAEARNIVLGRAHDHEAQHQAAAVKHKSRWTADEDAALIDRAGEPVHLLASDPGRRLWAVCGRRWKLRQRGLLD